MQNFILIISLIEAIICWLIYVPLRVIHKFTRVISRVSFLKLGIYCMAALCLLDILQLSLLVFNQMPTTVLTWISPLFWTMIGIIYHDEYLKLRKES